MLLLLVGSHLIIQIPQSEAAPQKLEAQGHVILEGPAHRGDKKPYCQCESSTGTFTLDPGRCRRFLSTQCQEIYLTTQEYENLLGDWSPYNL